MLLGILMMLNFLDDNNEMEVCDLYKEGTADSGKILIIANFLYQFLTNFCIKYHLMFI